MTGELNWIFWTLGGLLGLIGLILLLWSLFADRSKGRKRCPKCWYNMSHAPSLTCSECGYTIKREKKLCKTHRRWRWAVVAVILLIGSSSSSLTPKVKRDGWLSIVPTTALILTSAKDVDSYHNFNNLPSLSQIEYQLAEELEKRAYVGYLWSWQWRLLTTRMHPEDDASWVINSFVREEWPVGEPLYALVEHNNGLAGVAWLPPNELRIKVSTDFPTSDTWSCVLGSSHRYNYAIRLWTGTGIDILDSSTISGWNNPSLYVGDLPEGLHSIKLNVTLQHRYYNKDSWSTIWEGGIEQTVRIQGTIDDLLQPATNLQIEDDLNPSAFKVSSDGVIVEPLLLIAFNKWSTLALKFDLIKNNEVIRSAEAWWTPADLAVYRTLGATAQTLVPWDKPFSMNGSSSDLSALWELRVRAVPELALRANSIMNMPNLIGIEIPRSEILVDGDFIPGEVTYQLSWVGYGYLIPTK